MINKENIHNEVERTLQSLDETKRAEANPFLFTRLKAKMQKDASVWERTFSFISRPAVALAIVIFVMAINAWAVLGTETNENATAENGNATTSEIANEYNLVASVSNYDYEIVNQ
jgi:hypothetical protein